MDEAKVCEGCSTEGVELNHKNICVNCEAGLPKAGGDGEGAGSEDEE